MHKRGIRRPVIYSRPFSQIKLIPVNKALRGENRAVKPAGGKGEKMICPNCHSQIKEGSNFCPYCGYPIRRAEDATQAPPVGPSSDPEENPASASLQPSHQPQQPPVEPGSSFPQGPGAPMAGPGAPRLHRKLSAIEVWLIVIGIVALIALIISIVNAVHIETVKNALIEVIQNLQNTSN